MINVGSSIHLFMLMTGNLKCRAWYLWIVW